MEQISDSYLYDYPFDKEDYDPYDEDWDWLEDR
jgi:hypothetical protein